MHLKSYIASRSLTISAFAGSARLSASEVSKIANGRKAPSDLTLAKIEQATGGAVSRKDFSQEVPFQ